VKFSSFSTNHNSDKISNKAQQRLEGKRMTPEIPKPDNPVTPWLLKWIFLPLFGSALLIAFGGGVQINSW